MQKLVPFIELMEIIQPIFDLSVILLRNNITDNEVITSIKQKVFVNIIVLLENMQQHNIHYQGHLVQYSLNKAGIDSLFAGINMLSDL